MNEADITQKDPEVLRKELEALAEQDADHSGTFLSALSHTHARVREAAVWGLLSASLEKVYSSLLSVVQSDPALEVRAAAVFVLGRFVYEGQMADEGEAGEVAAMAAKVESVLRSFLNDSTQPPLLQRRALESLSFLEDGAIEGIIEQWSSHSDELYRKSAAFSMGRANPERFSRQLLKAMEDPSAMVRLEAVRSVGEQGLKKGVSRLNSLARGDDEALAVEAIFALGQVAGKQAEAALKDLLKSKDKVRAGAAREALAELNGED